MIERLSRILQALSVSAQEQMRWLRELGLTLNELPNDYADALRLVTDCQQLHLTAEQQATLERVDDLLEAMRAQDDESLWFAPALEQRQEWEQVRRAARQAARLVGVSDGALMDAVRVGPPDPEIVALETQLRAAQLAADTTVLDALISDALLFTGPDGQLATKAQDLDAHRSGVVRFRVHEPEELRIRRVNKDVAIAALRARLSVDVAGNVVSGTYRYTRVWARENEGTWRVVGGHVSPTQP